ncbi:membrane protein [Streptomyces spiralis]|uniref:Membrane protein n=1 Tax=Streptomyces spiralis TaxID=66376 RepID=A0A919AI25_9ACTN|nr:DMT family transporter [Streptomyces spiralis]GHF09473.1 membrane protein [Streptomyces spiralis]
MSAEQHTAGAHRCVRPAAGASSAATAAQPLALLLTLLVGTLIPLQGRINSELSSRVDDGLAAATVSFTSGWLIMTLVAAASPGVRRSLGRLFRGLRTRRLPRWYLVAGAFGSSLALAQSTTALITGLAVFTVAAIAGQTLSGLIVDSTGFADGLRRRPSAARLAGAALILAAAVIAAFPQLSSGNLADALLLALAPLVAGFLLGFQQAMNGAAGAIAGSPLAATWLNFCVGSLFLATVWGAKTLIGGGSARALPADVRLYLGGLYGVVFIAASALLVRRVGVLLLGMGSIAGQLIGSIVLDLVAPAGDGSPAVPTVLGALLTFAAVGIASRKGPDPARPPAEATVVK